MLTELATAYVDASAASLRLALGLPPQPALERAVLEVGGFAIDLRVLGASHQCIARAPSGGELSETVACLDGAAASRRSAGDAPGEPLPAARDAVAAGLRYAFTSRVVALEPGEVVERADALRRASAGDALALAGVFPGSPDALTALRCAAVPGGVAWSTVHLYPRTRELVETSTTLVAA